MHIQARKRKRLTRTVELIARSKEEAESKRFKGGFLDILPPLSTGNRKGLKGDHSKFRGWAHRNTYDPKLDPKKPKATKLEKALKASFDKDREDRNKGIYDVVEKGFKFQ